MTDACIPWEGTVGPKGYGVVKVQGARWLAHRLAYTQALGPIPPGLVIDHLCHNADLTCPGGTSCPHRLCVNPQHLEAITPAENNRRGRVNANKTHCKRGHPLDEANTYVHARGSRECRTCNAERARARHKPRQAATA